MKKSIIVIFTVFVVLGLTSCFKQEQPIPPHPKGPAQEVIIPLTQFYVNQVYFQLETGEQVSMNEKTDYDFCFSSADTGTLIRLNTANFMKAAITNYSELEQVKDTTGLVWLFDKSDGDQDSTALFDWIHINGMDTTYAEKVYVINLGINELGFTRGLRKAIFRELKNGVYHFTCSNMDDSGTKDYFIEKNPGHNYVQFSLSEGGFTHQFEPVTLDWDLLFTQYTTLLYTDEGEAYPYLVTGVLSNMSGTYMAVDSSLNFDHIVLDDVLFRDFSKQQDFIGYDWKELFGDINGGDFYYKARSNYNYFIRSKQGIYYKLRFTGFYDTETGEKGFPTFQFQRL